MGSSDKDLKLQCLILAQQLSSQSDVIVKHAEAFWAFISKPSGK